MKTPLFRKLDNHLLRVSDIDAAISFYRDTRGHPLIWRDEEAAGFALPETDAELVVHLRMAQRRTYWSTMWTARSPHS